MIYKSKYISCLVVFFLLFLSIGIQKATAQTTVQLVKGTVIESGTALPLKQVSITVTSTGKLAETDDKGAFTIEVPNLKAELTFNLPGYDKRTISLNGRETLNISLVESKFKSNDKQYYHALGTSSYNDATYSVKSIAADEQKLSKITSFDQTLQGLVAGLNVINHSGMPGQKTWLNIRGASSIFGKNQPLMIIDGMIYDYNYADNSAMEGFSINPLDVVDIEDIADISVLKNGDSHLGVAGSNGVIYVNTEQKSEASTLIKMSAYEGISFAPRSLDVLNANQFKDYLQQRLGEEQVSNDVINQKFSWLNGNNQESFRYGNNTNWQNEIFKPSVVSKYHIFLKGGDDIATYNISAGYLKHGGMMEDVYYSRFNLRINGKINITDRFAVMPNAKLTLADSKLPNLGPTIARNPIIASLLKPSIMMPNAREPKTGEVLPYLDDVGAFNVSNPVTLVNFADGTSRNYHFLSSINMQYKISRNLVISNLTGLNFNNARENIFIPNNGVVQIDSASNMPADFVNEFRSTQNHTTISYNNTLKNGAKLDAQAGMRYLVNSYKFNHALDLNTPSDDFKSLGQGSKYNYLRTSLGDNRGLSWISYYANANYNIYNKYYINANVSYDGNSANNKKNRYNLFPSLGFAWRISSEKFMENSSIDDLKLRASYSITGNMYNNIYDYSKLYYTEDRLNSTGVPIREAIPNEELEMEKTGMANLGLDITFAKQTANVHVDLYYGMVNNLIIEQRLPSPYGYTTFFNNGGQLSNTGVELSFDKRKHFGDIVWTIGGTATSQFSTVNKLDFILAGMDKMVIDVPGAQYATMVGNPFNAFYGYKTNGIYASSGDVGGMIGPKGKEMQAGDIRYVDVDNSNSITEKDKTVIGNPNPLVFGGLFSTVSYKNFGFSVLLNYSVGNDVFNYARYKAESMDTYANQFTTVLNRWTPTNTNATMPRGAFGDPTGNTMFSDRWIEDGSYLKFKQFTVSYNLPESGFYRGITLYLTASNLFTLTNYSGYDPEFFYQNNPFYAGIDYGKMPQARTILVGIKLDL